MNVGLRAGLRRVWPVGDFVSETDAGSETGAKRARAPTTLMLIRRMRAMLTRRLEMLEKEPMDAADKEMTLLGTMSRTLGKLIELDQERRAGTVARKSTASPELAALRMKIVERIDQLNAH
jgi:hypothetical protein